jgi:uncharacterized protein (DUF169 family)
MKQRIDFSIWKKFRFEHKPVAVKYLLAKPDGIARLDKSMSFCEMLKEAQIGDPFWTTNENHDCRAGPFLLGMEEGDPIFESGQIGAKLGVYEDPRANRRIYLNAPRLERGSVRYVVFSSLDNLTFDPDVFIVTAAPSQAEIVLRAAGYRSGSGWNAKGTSVLGCAWLYIHPYVSGELNVLITGLHHGMKVRRVLPEGLLLLSIPFDLLPEIISSLEAMEWNLPQFSWGKEAHKLRVSEIVDESRLALEK